jgi:hypothetical protein
LKFPDNLQGCTLMNVDVSNLNIEKKPPETELVDVMSGSARWEIKVHDHGLVALCDVMPRLVPQGKTADYAIVQAARVSYGQGTKQVNEDRGLIRYLARHRHTTPFESSSSTTSCRSSSPGSGFVIAPPTSTNIPPAIPS